MTKPTSPVERVEGFTRQWEDRIGRGSQASDLIMMVEMFGHGPAELRASDLRSLIEQLAEAREALEEIADTVQITRARHLARAALGKGDGHG